MKVVQINTTCDRGSTGKICRAISQMLSREGIENYILYTQSSSDYPLGIKYGNLLYQKCQALKSRIFGNYGFNSQLATIELIEKLKKIHPDIVHIHNIHSHDCNLTMLFRYLKANQIKVVWTFHDCWAFTGLCTYYDYAQCRNWKNGCHDCPQRKKYSWFFDRSTAMQKRKQKAQAGLKQTVVVPSRWLENQVKESFLKESPVQVIYNGIDVATFCPMEASLRGDHGWKDKFIVLGVAFGWDRRKGLDVFLELAKRLDDRYQIVLVGTDDNIDKKLPENIVSIHRTHSKEALAQLYSAADVFVNPTREDNFPTVNLEALACGTPVITFATGGSPEALDSTCGSVVVQNDIGAMECEVRRICMDKPYSLQACRMRALEFDETIRFGQYLELYRSLL